MNMLDVDDGNRIEQDVEVGPRRERGAGNYCCCFNSHSTWDLVRDAMVRCGGTEEKAER